jgi:hypothetical protein
MTKGYFLQISFLSRKPVKSTFLGGVEQMEPKVFICTQRELMREASRSEVL